MSCSSKPGNSTSRSSLSWISASCCCTSGSPSTVARTSMRTMSRQPSSRSMGSSVAARWRSTSIVSSTRASSTTMGSGLDADGLVVAEVDRRADGDRRLHDERLGGLDHEPRARDGVDALVGLDGLAVDGGHEDVERLIEHALFAEVAEHHVRAAPCRGGSRAPSRAARASAAPSRALHRAARARPRWS